MRIDIEEFPDSYSYERTKRLEGSASGIRYVKQRLGETYKKNSQSSDPEKRSRFCQKIEELKKEDKQIDYVYESVFADDILMLNKIVEKFNFMC
ncbi:hypothetical protein [Holospora undulata]|uniref:Transposase n=1 Tax=Holospora undulata HU1 TaxID=1321371 RepID=A0A061JIY0_9PROT|nr:hypothetical protein [Holospora undulata]ETZ05349.1 hypothetical protein K737_300213 [Holospora undulata HU1]